MLLVVTALLSPGGGLAKRIFAVVFIGLAAYSSFLALRDTVVAPDNRLHEVAELTDQVAGEKVLALTSDRFTDYGLRSATVYSPAFNAEIRVASTGAKTQRLPIDFDSVPDEVLNQFLTRSPPAPSIRARRRRAGPRSPQTSPTGSGSAPAQRRESRCLPRRRVPGASSAARTRSSGRSSPEGEALVWPRPVIAKRLYWQRAGKADNQAKPSEEVSQSIVLPRAPGRSRCSTSVR